MIAPPVPHDDWYPVLCHPSQMHGDREVFPTDRKIVASYSRKDGDEVENPSVCVPGEPPLLLRGKIHEIFELPRDERKHTEHTPGIDAELPSTKWMEILYSSIRLCSPGFDSSTVDIVTDRFVLNKLLRFCGSPGDR